MKVSVIMAARDAQAHIARALDSALAQTHANLELIVVDDGSSDGTASIVAEFRVRDPRVTLLRHPAPRGPSAARNTGLSAATGDWIAILDSDDAFLPHRLEKMLARALADDLDALADGVVLIDSATNASLGPAFPPRWFQDSGPINLAFMLQHDWPGWHGRAPFGLVKPIFKRAVLAAHALRYAEDIRLGEDLLLYAELLLCGTRFGLIQEPMYLYTLRGVPVFLDDQIKMHHIEVNRRMLSRAKGLAAAQPSSAPLVQLLMKREQALWFQLAFYFAKRRRLASAISAFRELPMTFIAVQLLKRGAKTLRRWLTGSPGF